MTQQYPTSLDHDHVRQTVSGVSDGHNQSKPKRNNVERATYVNDEVLLVVVVVGFVVGGARMKNDFQWPQAKWSPNRSTLVATKLVVHAPPHRQGMEWNRTK